MERCGKINTSNSGSESWTGIGVVAGFWAVVLIRQGPHGKKSHVHWRSGLLQRLQEVRSNCKTRNQLNMSLQGLGGGGGHIVAEGCYSWYSEPMEQTPFELTP